MTPKVGTRGKPDMAKREQARALRAAGKTLREIGEALGISITRAHHLLKPWPPIAGRPNVV